jgi:UDP-N-acetylglucosamine 2-epimerase (non-hydrolysing)
MSKKLKIMHVVGARPNFIKIAPLVAEIKKHPQMEQILVHTGQHYDEGMSQAFFKDLGLPFPDIQLNVGSGSHAIQTAKIMERFEPVLLKQRPDLLIVVGDVNSTIACGLTAVKLGIPVAHVEAGLRSFDRTMPEEINRILTDAISDYLFTTEQSANENLLREGIPKEKVFFVGNVMIDTLLKHQELSRSSPILSVLNLQPKAYAVLTLHRPSNVDHKGTFQKILKALFEIAQKTPIIFPCHPRTKKKIQFFGLEDYFTSYPLPLPRDILLIDPLGYLDFLRLVSEARFVLTDSGGIQEETTALGIPCLTLRENTERPVTVTQGTNVVVGINGAKILEESLKILDGKPIRGRMPELWDGKSANRILRILSGSFKL